VESSSTGLEGLSIDEKLPDNNFPERDPTLTGEHRSSDGAKGKTISTQTTHAQAQNVIKPPRSRSQNVDVIGVINENGNNPLPDAGSRRASDYNPADDAHIPAPRRLDPADADGKRFACPYQGCDKSKEDSWSM
jgi:hypothetical protein